MMGERRVRQESLLYGFSVETRMLPTAARYPLARGAPKRTTEFGRDPA